jgi:hypothetical protein
MYPYYRAYPNNIVKLDNDDIKGMQSLYGKRNLISEPTSEKQISDFEALVKKIKLLL